jgi:hypothetical protein
MRSALTHARQVLEGIQYLRGYGRALAALSADTILLSESGEVKIGRSEEIMQVSWQTEVGSVMLIVTILQPG